MKPAAEDSISCGDIEDVSPNLASKWSVKIVALLSRNPRRFSELKRDLGMISQKSLTSALRELEKDGMVKRTVTPVIPPRVDYELTALGQSALQPLRALGNWAFENREAVIAARRRFEELN